MYKIGEHSVKKTVYKFGGHSIMFFNAFRNEICRQSNQIAYYSVIAEAYPEGGLPLSYKPPLIKWAYVR